MSLNILIWQIHGSYLNTLVQAPHRFYLPTKPDKPEGYGGRGASHDWSADTIEVPAEEVRDLDLDLIAGEKQIMDVAGHYNRPDLFELTVRRSVRPQITFTSETGDLREAADRAFPDGG